MEPAAALRDALEALTALHDRECSALPDELPKASADERQQAVDCLENLAAWLKKGGHSPNVDEVLNDMHFYN